ncbi:MULTISPECIES: LysR family transcriptional regulator [Nostoc]|uniref:LysR family transcriptional regulator n=1 Tax=Nostoc paludosum FACHB-159 TaxID=2692908 RepID=A0ABR8KFT2_9NOSO|nr:LysR family transcriptional regulator [Nostoc sp. FACHB-857]MBD2737145.1 LysR family transcriptional regulator [Nostoc paludosum FACHB-159]
MASPQPHLSKQIKKLEKLGIELFVRKPRLELTPYGQRFFFKKHNTSSNKSREFRYLQNKQVKAKLEG